MSGFGNCCDFRKSHLLCDLPKGLTGKSQVYAVELVLLEYFVSSIKTLRECLVQVILSWKAYSALRDCGFLICFQPTLSCGPNGLTDVKITISGRFKCCLFHRKILLLLRENFTVYCQQ